ncbi:hypothetical protein EGI16_12155 [Chryseobacterium sp. G0240]|uniref:hypothetical protein n=1 Tax=Chryseobacterium sp. G0240 TaxID=2487066 RepID=UPI000F449AF4|nr:hypothetical protein [Chryseobacterium sp. G0240]ROI02918.1 hypothetical protein EGI16_12155 [Chryseobacterium sp. G0240]
MAFLNTGASAPFNLKNQNYERLTKKLISEPYDKNDIPKSYDLICNYAEFLRQPLTLGMFVPVDEDGGGDVIEKPNSLMYELAVSGNKTHQLDIKQWNTATEKVLFEGFEYVSQSGFTRISLSLTTAHNLRLIF